MDYFENVFVIQSTDEKKKKKDSPLFKVLFKASQSYEC